jgi:hypothetical protein
MHAYTTRRRRAAAGSCRPSIGVQTR